MTDHFVGRCIHCGQENLRDLTGPCANPSGETQSLLSLIAGDLLTEAVAEAWASIDGRLEAFRACKADPTREETEGRYGGYMADAEELIKRIEARRGDRVWRQDRLKEIARALAAQPSPLGY